MFNMDSHPAKAFDVVLVGGGLQSALVALCLLERRPAARVAWSSATAHRGTHTGRSTP